jgi:hypothetical protein
VHEWLGGSMCMCVCVCVLTDNNQTESRRRKIRMLFSKIVERKLQILHRVHIIAKCHEMKQMYCLTVPV